jgi:ATP phosphoribosyltransferase
MIRIGVPSKGRLMQDTFDWFGARGLTMRRTGNDREYAGAVDGIEGVGLVLLSAGEIPRELAAGRIHLGVTGSDLMGETLGMNAPEVQELARLGFGHADLILAVPNVWIDVETVDDLDAAAAGFRAVHGHRLRIATKYHRLTRDFLQARGGCGLPTGRQPGRDGRHRQERHRRGDCGYHLLRRDAAGKPPAHPFRRADPFQRGGSVGVPHGRSVRR